MKYIKSDQLSQISGGMRWEGNRASTNVVDLRYPGLIGFSLPDGGFNYSNPNYGNEARGGGSRIPRYAVARY